jgi:hypothetical protein
MYGRIEYKQQFESEIFTDYDRFISCFLLSSLQ